jgi:spore germination protein KB
VSDRITISGGLYACLLVIYVHVAAVQYLPGPLLQIAEQDAWLSLLLGGLFGLSVGFLALWATRQHPGLGGVALAKRLLGRWLGSLVGLVYWAFFFWIFSLVVRNVVDFVVLILLPGTPGRVIAFVLAGVALYAAWHGIEAIARVGFQTMVALVAANLALPLLLGREFHVLQRSPVLEHGFGPALAGGVHAFPWFGEALVVLTLGAHLNPRVRAWRWTAIGVAGAAAILISLVGLTILTMGPDLPGRFIFPSYVLIQLISIAHIVERIELALVTVWLSGMVVKMSTALYVTAESVSHLLGLRSHRWPAVVMAVAGAALTQIWSSALDLSWFNATPLMRTAHLAVELGLPLCLLAGAFVRWLFRAKGTAHAQA